MSGNACKRSLECPVESEVPRISLDDEPGVLAEEGNDVTEGFFGRAIILHKTDPGGFRLCLERCDMYAKKFWGRIPCGHADRDGRIWCHRTFARERSDTSQSLL